MDCFVQPLGKGHSSQTYLLGVKNNQKELLKLEKTNSHRIRMIEKESAHLMEANRFGVGPTLLAWNERERWVLMEFIEGKTLRDWLNENQSKQKLRKLLKELFRQAKLLDSIGLDHGQLAGMGKNIIVRNNGFPCIIDFEKASIARKPHNLNQLKSFLLESPHGKIAKIVRETLGLKTVTFETFGRLR